MVARALVLNASHEPLSVVSCRRAVVLVIRGRAVVMEHRHEEWSSERMTVPVPSVVRLTSYVSVPYGRKIAVTSKAVFGRDGYRCQYCSGPAESIDHVVPRSRGGQHTWENVVACCRRCNVKKGDRLPSEVGFDLNRRPGTPMRHAWVYAAGAYSVDPIWERYLPVDSG